MTFNEKIEKYAELAIAKGVNLQKGQTLVIFAPVETADFVRVAAEKAYERGAATVHIEWEDARLTKVKLEKTNVEDLFHYPKWKIGALTELAKNNAAFLHIASPSPNLLKDVDPEKTAALTKTRALELKEFNEYRMKGSYSIIAVPTKDWAAKVYPNLNEGERLDRLWDNVFEAARVSSGNPIDTWETHVKQLSEKLKVLNDQNFKKLHYEAPGTHLSIELPADHLWIGGGGTSENGVFISPNIPTEEVFTLPKKDGVNGVVKSTMPLNYGGRLLEDFSLTFEDGKVVQIEADDKVKRILENLINTDEGSAYLGEIALVPQNSPIAQLKAVFFNTLYDENASCHIALGKAYPLSMKGGTKMDAEDFSKNGGNTSLVHVDFMIGSDELNVDAEPASGEIVPIFRNGLWAI